MCLIDYNGVIREMTDEEIADYMGEKREVDDKNDNDVQPE